MRTALTVRRLAQTAAAVTAAAVTLALGPLAIAAPLASASTGVGWVRLAHLSPNAPSVDVYLYSFGDSSAQIVLHHVSYGTVSPFEQVAAGDYTVAMRSAGAPAHSKPVLSTAVDVVAGHAYTVAGMGPASGLRLQVIPDRLTAPPGKALVRVIQASLNQQVVAVTVGRTKLARHLKFASVTGYRAVKPGTLAIRVTGSSESGTATENLMPDSLYTLVVLDSHGTLKIDCLMDAQGSKVNPAGAPMTGFGGTAAEPGAALLPWAAAGVAGLLMAATGIVLVMRRRRPALHTRQRPLY
ncbi:MAG TPA: DUF4397 domain-containing protein [Streptosporangiaceae bacterium]|nr:DUF4397 domain-containing protein [Streptosporangiaceae bacterium]